MASVQAFRGCYWEGCQVSGCSLRALTTPLLSSSFTPVYSAKLILDSFWWCHHIATHINCKSKVGREKGEEDTDQILWVVWSHIDCMSHTAFFPLAYTKTISSKLIGPLADLSLWLTGKSLLIQFWMTAFILNWRVEASVDRLHPPPPSPTKSDFDAVSYRWGTFSPLSKLEMKAHHHETFEIRLLRSVPSDEYISSPALNLICCSSGMKGDSSKKLILK